VALLGTLCLLLLWAPVVWLPAQAQTPQPAPPPRAGLVVLHGDGALLTRCVELPAEQASGYELLQASGLEMHIEASAMGATICSLDGEGCGAGEGCFCRCTGTPCIYWSYWQLVEGEWRYSNLGAASSRLEVGAVEAWVWGSGQAGDDGATQLPTLSFADICIDAPATAQQANAQEQAVQPDPTMTAPAAPLPPPAGWGLLLAAGAPLAAFALWFLFRKRS
jgi:hypothetical protein